MKIELNLGMLEPLLNLWPIFAVIFVVIILAPVIRKHTLPRFRSRVLLNKSEQRLFPMIVGAVPAGHHVMCQVSYGEFLSCTNTRKYWSINAKRADFVICDPLFQVVTVIEYQGSGHYGTTQKSRINAEGRDVKKRRALSEAGIVMVEMPAKFDVALVRSHLEHLSAAE